MVSKKQSFFLETYPFQIRHALLLSPQVVLLQFYLSYFYFFLLSMHKQLYFYVLVLVLQSVQPQQLFQLFKVRLTWVLVS